jgi:hypothetical protein
MLPVSYLPMNNCKNTVSNWLLFRNNFVTPHVPPLLISAINPFHKKKNVRLHLKCDGTRAETSFRLPTKRTSPLKSTGASVQSITGSRGVRISGSNGSNPGYNMFRGSVMITGYPLHSPISPSLPLPCVTVCYHISTGLYLKMWCWGFINILLYELCAVSIDQVYI